jgi:hypothetical protein
VRAHSVRRHYRRENALYLVLGERSLEFKTVDALQMHLEQNA